MSEFEVKGSVELDTNDAVRNLTNLKNGIERTFDSSPLNAFQASLSKTNARINDVFNTITKVSAIAAGGFGLTSIVSGAAAAGDALYKLSTRFNMTIGEASQFSRIMTLTGSNAMTAMGAISRLDRTVTSSAKSAETAKKVLEMVGVSLADQDGKLLPVNQQLAKLAEGYQKASEAGYGQEFVMLTLGNRGMALVGTLKEYNEAAKIAQSIQGVGLKPDEMHELSNTIKQVNAQFGSMKLLAGVALAPLAQQILNSVIPSLQNMAKYFAENKATIQQYVVYLAQVVALYEGLKLVSNFADTAKSIYSVITATEAATAATTKMAEEQVAQVSVATKAIESYYTEMAEKAIQTAAESSSSAEEFSNTVQRELAKIAEEAQVTSAKVQASFTSAFNASGNAAVEASGKVAVLTATTEASGNAAVVAGSKAVSATTEAAAKVPSLTKNVLSLAGGWVGVAWAIGSAVVALHDFIKADQQRYIQGEKSKNGADTSRTISINGWEYAAINADDTSQGFVRVDREKGIVRNAYKLNGFTQEKAEQLYHEKYDAEDAERAQALKDNTASTFDISEATKKLQEQFGTFMQEYSAESEKSGGKGSKKDEPKEDTAAMKVMKELISAGFREEQAAGIVGNLMQESGGGTENLRTDIWGDNNTSYGIAQWHREKDLGNTRLDKLQEFQAKYYKGRDDLETQIAFLIDELTNGDEKVAGQKIKQATTVEEATTNGDKYYERSDGTTTAQRIEYAKQILAEYQSGSHGSSSNGISKRVQQIATAKKQLEDLEKALDTSTNEVIGTEYENKVHKLDDDIEKKKKQIESIKAVSDGIDTSKAEKMLETYKTAKMDEINKEWAESLDKVRQKTQQTTAEATGDYKALAQIQYENTIKQAELEEEEQIKKLSRYKGDVEAKKVAEDEKTAKVLQATQQRETAERESFERTANLKINNGDYEGLTNLLNSKDGMDFVDWQSSKESLQEYMNLWKASHVTALDMANNLAKSLQSNLDTFFQDAFIGTNSFMDSVYNLVMGVFKNMLTQITNMWASQLSKNVLGRLMGQSQEKGTVQTAGQQVLYNAAINGAGSTINNAISGIKNPVNARLLNSGAQSLGSYLGKSTINTAANAGINNMLGGSKSLVNVGQLANGNQSLTSVFGNSSLFKKGKSNPLNQLESSIFKTKDTTELWKDSLKNSNSIIGTSTELLGVDNEVQGVINTVTKPQETTQTETVTIALTALTHAAEQAAVALASIKAGGFLTGHATGGYISGPGTPTSDSIPAMLSDGEFVLRAETVKRIGVPTLNAINEGRTKHFAAGGYVSAINASYATVEPSSNVNLSISAIDARSLRSFLKQGGLKEIKQALFSDSRNFATKAGVW